MYLNNKLTGQPNMLKQVNRGLIKDALKILGTATRVEISEMTQISQPTVNAIINQMIRENTVIEKGIAVSSGGRRAMKFGLNTEAICVAAVFAEAESLEYEIRDISERILERGKYPIHTKKSYLDNLQNTIDRILLMNERIKSITIGVPGAVTEHGKIVTIPQISELEGCDLLEAVTGRIRIAVNVINDINSTALGYFQKESVQKTEDMVYIHMGEGLGAGIIIRKRLLNGFSSFAGEISHMTVNGRYNAEQTLSSSNGEEIEEIISGVVINIICLLNPPLIVMGGSLIHSGLIEKIRSNCINKLPGEMMPHFTEIADEKKYYFNGLIDIAINAISEEIRLVQK